MTILKKLTFALVFVTAAVAQNVVTQHYDIARSGQNVSETTLLPANVNTNGFGRLFSVPVQGYVYAQPLYMSNLTIPGRGQHNVVFIATEHDSVYAFDADTNGGASATPLWQVTLLDAAHGAAPGAATEPNGNVSTQDITPEIGITGTPVIDPNSGTMYLVGQTIENGVPIQRLHALDVTSGAEKFGGPVTLAASVPGTGNGSSGGILNFDPKWANNRAGLLLLNGIVYLAFGSHGDNGPWHGWILAYNAATLAQTGVFCTTANGTGSGIWMAGSGLAADVVDPVNSPFGRLFVATGNGSYNATIPYTNTMSYGDDMLRLDLTNGTPTIAGAFTPYNQQQLSASDADLASGGILLLPDQTTGGHTHLMVQAGKQGTLYLVDRDNMGDFGAADNVVQEITGQINGLWSMPTYWNNNVYIWGNGDHLKAFSLSNGLLSATPTSVGSETSQFPGSTATVSANGTANGIVWNIQSDAYGSGGPAILLAHDATNVATTLYSSSQNATRDAPGSAVKFTVPVVMNGKVYVGAQNQFSVYGLLNGEHQAAAPVIQPASQTFLGSVSVTITDTTSGAAIYYTTDGTLPTEASNLYTGPFSVTTTTTIKAMASATGFLQSPVTAATYTSQTQVAAPAFSPAAGAYTSAQVVTISDVTPSTVIYYTLDGTAPTTSSAIYSAPIQVSANVTINAMAAASGLDSSPTSTASYAIQLGGTGINFGNGFSTAPSSTQFNGSTGLDDSRLQLTNGGVNQAGSAFYKTPVGIQNFTNDFAFQLSNPNGHGITFTIQGNSPTALGGIGAGLGYGPATTGGTGGIPNSVAVKFDLYSNAGEGNNSTGLYINGAIPTVPAVTLPIPGINLHSGDTMQVHMTYDGATLAMTITDPVVNKSFTTTWQIDIPSTVGSGTAYIGFTGSTGTITSSQKIMTWTYVTIAPQTATPIFSPVGGSYMPPQSVTITDATPSASIFYTTDGSTPTSASTPYTNPIALSASTTVINAIAIAAQASSIASATYQLMDFGLSASPASLTVQAGNSGTTMIAVAPVNGFNGSVALSAAGLPSGVTASFNPASTTGSSTLTLTVAANAAAGTSTITVTGVAGTLTRTKTVSLTIPAPQTQVTAPVFAPAGGTYTTAQSVAISDTTPNAKIYYTLDGTTPTTSSAVYSSPIQVSSSLTVNAMAAAAGLTNSPVSSVTYSIQTAQAGINFGGGFSGAQSTLQFNGSTTLDSSSKLQLTNGGVNQTGSAFYKAPIGIQSFTNDFTFQIINPNAHGMTFAIQGNSATALGGIGAGLGYGPATTGASGGIPNSVAVKFDLYSNAGEGNNSTGLYTNGAIPTVPAITIGNGVSLHSGDTMSVHMAYDGTTLTMTITDTVTSKAFTTSWPINIPAVVGGNQAYVGFTASTGTLVATQKVLTWTYATGLPQTTAPALTPASGSYLPPQSVTITDATPGAPIFYTTDGSTPTSASTLYTGPIALSAATTVINAIAVEGSSSTVTSATYQLTNFAVSAAPASLTVSGGNSGTTTIALTPINGFNSSASLSTSGLPSGVTASFNPSSTTGSSTLTLTAAATAAAGTFNITITGVAGSLTHSTTVSLTIPVPPPPVTAPVFSLAGGTYTTAQTVTISDTTPNATIYYTLDGTTPTISSAVYSSPIQVSSNLIINAMAAAAGMTNSSISTATYSIQPGGIGANFGSGFSGAQSVMQFNGTTTLNGSQLQLTNGLANQTASAFYQTVLPVQNFTTDFAFQILNPNGHGITFTIQGNGPTAIGQNGAGLGYGPATTGGTGGIPNSVAVKFDLYSNAGEGNNSTGLYTNGAIPTVPAITIGNGVSLHSGDTMSVHMTYDGTTLTMAITDTVTSKAFTTSWPVNIPAVIGGNLAYVGFTASTGTLVATQNVLTWTYVTVPPQMATPALNPASGSYLPSQSVTITDAIPGASIFYTTDGSTPTSASTSYTGPIALSTPTTTINAIAIATGYGACTVASATYQLMDFALSASPASLAASTGTSGTTMITVAPMNGFSSSVSLSASGLPSGVTASFNPASTTGSSTLTLTVAANAAAGTSTITVTGVAGTLTRTKTVSLTIPAPQTQVTAPVFAPAGGTYTTAQSVAISDTTPNAKIYYTLDGTTPTTSSAVYSSPIQVSSSLTVNAMAAAAGLTNSPVSSVTYSIQTAQAGINFGGGFSGAQSTLQFNGSTTLDSSSKLQLTNGGVNQTGSAFYKAPIGIQSFTNDFTFQIINPNAHGMTFAIQGNSATALGGIGAGLGYGPATTGASGGIPNSVAVKFDLYSNAGEGNNSTGLYTNGAIPTVPAITIGNGVSLHSGDTMSVHMAYDGTTLTMTITDTVTSKAFTTSWPINIPAVVGGNQAYVGFTASTGTLVATQKVLTWTYATGLPQTTAPALTPASGSYLPPQSVTITDATPGAPIFYTTDGSTPTSASTLYTGPIALSAATTVINAIAVEGSSSTVTSATYQLTNFAVSAAPASLTVSGGNSGTTTIALTPINGFNSSASLSTSGLPSGVTASFNPSSTTGSSTLTLTAAATAAAGTFNITITGVAGSLTHSTTVSLTIPVPPPPVTAPVFSLAGGTYTTAQTVTISDTTPNATIYYTLDGTTPTISSAVYSSPIQVSSNLIINAMAAAAGMTNSSISTATYSIQPGGIGANFGSGFSGAQSVMQFNGTTTLNGSQLQLTNGLANQTASAFYQTVLPVQNFTTDFAFQILNPNGHGITFTIQGNGPTAIGQNGAGLGYGPATTGGTGGIPNSVAVKFDLYSNAGEGNNSTGLYTNGAIPTVPAITIGNGVSLHSGDTMSVHMTYDGTTLTMAITDTVTSKAFTTSWPVNIPAVIGGNLAYVGFTASTGTLVATQNVLTWTYVTVPPQMATPALNPASGSYLPSQSVTITDAIPGASIFYTTDGSTPTSASTSYTGPIALSTPTTTINAIAIATGYGACTVASATYQLMDFALSASPASLAVSPGNSGTSTITVLPMNGFSGSVALSASGLPNGVTPSFDQPSTSGSSTLTLTLDPSTANGTFTITISGVAGNLARSTTVSLTVQTVMTQVNLWPVFNMSGIYTDGTPFTTGGLDGNGYAYSANLLGSRATWNNATFTFGPANAVDAVANATIGLPAGSFSVLNMLATGVNGRQRSQQFVVGYADGTTTTFTISLSDWHLPHNYADESVVQTMNYRDQANGGSENGSYSVYGYSFNLNPAKVITSIALPNNQNVAVLAMTLMP